MYLTTQESNVFSFTEISLVDAKKNEPLYGQISNIFKYKMCDMPYDTYLFS